MGWWVLLFRTLGQWEGRRFLLLRRNWCLEGREDAVHSKIKEAISKNLCTRVVTGHKAHPQVLELFSSKKQDVRIMWNFVSAQLLFDLLHALPRREHTIAIWKILHLVSREHMGNPSVWLQMFRRYLEQEQQETKGEQLNGIKKNWRVTCKPTTSTMQKSFEQNTCQSTLWISLI